MTLAHYELFNSQIVERDRYLKSSLEVDFQILHSGRNLQVCIELQGFAERSKTLTGPHYRNWGTQDSRLSSEPKFFYMPIKNFCIENFG